VIDVNREIQELEQEKAYKYLGIEGGEGIQHQQMKEILKQEYSRRLTLRLLMSYIYGVPGKARNANVVYIWTYVWQR